MRKHDTTFSEQIQQSEVLVALQTPLPICCVEAITFPSEEESLRSPVKILRPNLQLRA